MRFPQNLERRTTISKTTTQPNMSSPAPTGKVLSAALSVRAVLPACKRSPVLYPHGIATHAINQQQCHVVAIEANATNPAYETSTANSLPTTNRGIFLVRFPIPHNPPLTAEHTKRATKSTHQTRRKEKKKNTDRRSVGLN